MLRRSDGALRFSRAALRSYTSPAVQPLKRVDPYNTDKKKVVIVGTGWAGSRVAMDMDPKKFDITVLSMRNHMIFTPLLPQSATGTLEFRSVCESIHNIQPALANKGSGFIPAAVHDLDYNQKIVKCVAQNSEGEAQFFNVPYDYLVLAHGAVPLTFGVPGVQEHAYFLREIPDARAIRRKLLRNLETAALPTIAEDERRNLLHVVIVGGGPTGVEFAGDLINFINKDVRARYPALADLCKITIVEAMDVLGPFDKKMREYAVHSLLKSNINIVKAACKKVTKNTVELSSGQILNFGTMVWSTGVGASPLTRTLTFDKTVAGRIAVDRWLRVLVNNQPIPDVYSLGDAATIVGTPLPCLAAVANRQGSYLAGMLNEKETSINTRFADESQIHAPFSYFHVGSMISLGRGNALVDFAKDYKNFDMTGFTAFLFWRSAYLSMLTSVHWKVKVLSQWISTSLFGRDTTYIPNEEEDLKNKASYENILKQLAEKKNTTVAPSTPKN